MCGKKSKCQSEDDNFYYIGKMNTDVYVDTERVYSLDYSVYQECSSPERRRSSRLSTGNKDSKHECGSTGPFKINHGRVGLKLSFSYFYNVSIYYVIRSKRSSVFRRRLYVSLYILKEENGRH